MDVSVVLEWVKGVFPVAGVVLQIMGSFVIVASVVVKATQSKSDDEAFAKFKSIPILGSLINGLERFSLFDRKPE